MKIRRNDKVKITCGKDLGKQGKVIKSIPEKGKVTVEGLNLITKHVRPKREGEKGQKVKVPNPINVSNVMLICPKCNKVTRIGYQKSSDGKKTRICKKCGESV